MLFASFAHGDLLFYFIFIFIWLMVAYWGGSTPYKDASGNRSRQGIPTRVYIILWDTTRLSQDIIHHDDCDAVIRARTVDSSRLENDRNAQ